jgi:hypothetical protein
MHSSLRQYIHVNGHVRVPIALARKTEPIPEQVKITRPNQQGLKSLTKATDVFASFKEYKDSPHNRKSITKVHASTGRITTDER